MNCREIEKDLIPYADGDLNDVRAEMIKSHLASCADCQAALHPIQQTLDMAKTYRVPIRSGCIPDVSPNSKWDRTTPQALCLPLGTRHVCDCGFTPIDGHRVERHGIGFR